MNIAAIIAGELEREESQIANVIQLLDEGNTIPFIARYRKELHGAMDDTALRTLESRLQYLRNLQERRETVRSAIAEQGKLTEELVSAIENTRTLAELEDVYRPYKPKRRTRASIAREKGLAPLAETLFAQRQDGPAPEEAAAAFLDPEKGVETIEEALAGASDIIAEEITEEISDNAALRKSLRFLAKRGAVVHSEAATDEDSVYRMYYDFTQPLSRLQGYQILALNRGEKEKFLKVTVEVDHDRAMETVYRTVALPASPSIQTMPPRKSFLLNPYRKVSTILTTLCFHDIAYPVNPGSLHLRVRVPIPAHSPRNFKDMWHAIFIQNIL